MNRAAGSIARSRDPTAPAARQAADSPPPPLERYRHALGQFPVFVRQGIATQRVAEREYLLLGPARCEENSLRTLGNFVFAGGLVHAQYSGTADSGQPSPPLLEVVRSSLAYLTATHRSGVHDCVGGGRWGSSWQSAWWATRMALGARLIWDTLNAQEQHGVRRVLAAEADRFVGVPARTGLFRDTKAEENAWDTEVLATALALCPKHAHREAWRATLIEYALNSLSTPQDRIGSRLVDGRLLKEQVYTVNLHSDYTLENHGPYHFCYMASAMHSLVWGWYALRSAGQAVPEAQLNNLLALWDRIRPTFLENRFAYLAGQDWARYTYGLYFILPVLVFIGRHFHDAAALKMADRRLERLVWEQQFNGDGSFFGRRVTHGRMFGQWLKYETDCYANVGLAWLLAELLDEEQRPPVQPDQPIDLSGRHLSPEAGLVYVRTPRLFASFSWECLEGPYPLALFVPEGTDDATEWARNNLLAVVEPAGPVGDVLFQRRMQVTDRGFRVEGRIMHRAPRGGFLWDHDLFLELLADDGILIVENRCVARRDFRVRGTCGLRLYLANDIFNACRRSVYTPTGTVLLEFDPDRWTPSAAVRRARRVLRRVAPRWVTHRAVLPGSWINIDERLGLIADQEESAFTAVRTADRTAPWESLHVETVELDAGGPRRVRAGSTVVHSRCVCVAGDCSRTREIGVELSRYRTMKLRPQEDIC